MLGSFHFVRHDVCTSRKIITRKDDFIILSLEGGEVGSEVKPPIQFWVQQKLYYVVASTVYRFRRIEFCERFTTVSGTLTYSYFDECSVLARYAKIIETITSKFPLPVLGRRSV